MSRRLRATKEIIDRLMRAGRVDDAALSASNPMHTKLGVDYLFEARLGNVGLDFQEQQDADHYCITKHGFDARRQRLEWLRKNKEEILDRFRDSGLSSTL